MNKHLLVGIATGAVSFGVIDNIRRKFKQTGLESEEDSNEPLSRERRKRINEILKYGQPERGHPIKKYSNHVVCYDQEKKIPLWVAEHLTTDILKGPGNRGKAHFKADPSIENIFSANNSDYWKSGWTRGHMTPAADNKHTQESMDESFYLSNIVPQNYENNAGFWNRLEMYCRDDLPPAFKNVRVISGPVMRPGDPDEDEKKYVKYQIIGNNEVAVPTHLYKVVVVDNEEDSSIALGAFIVPNKPIGFVKDLKDFQVPLEFLEKQTGVRFLPRLQGKSVKDLCDVHSCKLMGKDQYDLYVIARKLSRAKTEERVQKLWKEIEMKNLKPDAYMENLYNTKMESFKSQSHGKSE